MERIKPWIIIFLVVVAVQILGRRATVANSAPSFEEIIRQVSSVSPDLRTFIVDQVADVRFLGIFRWRIHGTVYAARPASYRVVLHDAPVFLRSLGEAFSDATSPDRMLADYLAASIKPASGNRLVIDLVGARPSVNPPTAVITIDAARWLVEETVLKYAWGEVQAAYQYEDVSGYLLPVTVHAHAPQFLVSADLTFANYRLNVSLPPGVFATPANGPASPHTPSGSPAP